MTIKALYPTVRPTLNLDFAKTKVLDPRITFTRASTATFVGADGLIQTAASGAARFDHNPATRESLGLLVEEARTNLLTYSEQFDNAAWVKPLNTTVTANTHVAPDGTTTADTINAISNQITRSAAVTASATYTVSVFIRKTTGATIFPMLAVNEFTSGGQRVFNTNTGQLVITNAALNTGIQSESVGDYWRVSYSGNVGANTTLGFLIYPAASNDGSSYVGSLAGSVVAWGAQLEAGSFPTSYIPTTTATVTRAADVASMTGTNFSSWYNNTEGTVFADFRLEADRTGTRWAAQIGPTALTGPNSNVIGKVDINLAYAETRDGSVTQYSAARTFSSSRRAKIAYAIKNLSHQAAFDGVLATAGTGTLGTPSNTVLLLGRNIASTEMLCGTIARFAFYPVRLPDAQHQALTAT